MTTPPPTPPPPYSLRKRIIGGGIIAGVIGLAIWLGNFGLGPGLGPGEGGGDGVETDSGQSADTTDGDVESGNDAAGTSDEEVAAVGGEPPLRVHISGTVYRIRWSNAEEYVPATLEQIVDIAVSMPLEQEERRVLITHDPTGESGAHSDLRQALMDAGLTELQFDSAREPVTAPP